MSSRSIGILREVKNVWERRCALTPSQCKGLVERGIRVVVQPCEKRIFKNIEYANVGCVIQEDVSECPTIIGVKEFPAESLIPDRNYMMFSHVIKGQTENMPFLNACLEKNVRLFDYEGIRKPVDEGSLRLVAFGYYAGLAGMVTGCRGLGEQLLGLGYHTPFLFTSSTYMYPSLQHAKRALAEVGEEIYRLGLPRDLGPITFVFTGGGNVTRGAVEMFKMLPFEMVEPEDLPKLQNNFDNHKVYGCILPTSALVESAHPDQTPTPFEEQHYFEFPELYKPVFHEKIAPYTSVMVHGSYWDARYPRLLTDEQLEEVKNKNPRAFLSLFDISCDREGAFQFFKKTTSTADPFFVYNSRTGEVTPLGATDPYGVCCLGVDALPAELPKESSSFFGSALEKYIDSLADLDTSMAKMEDSKDLPVPMQRACITWNKSLTDEYRYLTPFLQDRGSTDPKGPEASTPSSRVIRIDGHLFDSGLVNHMFDLIEAEGGSYQVTHLQSQVNTREMEKASIIILQVSAPEQGIDHLCDKIDGLAKMIPKAKAIITHLPFGAVKTAPINKLAELSKAGKKREDGGPLKKITILGSGFVVEPCVEYLVNNGNNDVTIASNILDQAKDICSRHPHTMAASLDAMKEPEKLDLLVKNSDLVISLLPAPLHPSVAEKCIKHRVDMVTASYVSPGIQELHSRALDAGVTILNEVGLDPGLDHMETLRILDEIEKAGGKVKGYKSVCGGLPAPEATVNNPFMYKFSWNPAGVLQACFNNAKYLLKGKVVEVDGSKLLEAAGSLDPNPLPAIMLEDIPNRDSTIYQDLYQLGDAETVYRGTLRYGGFGELMAGINALGLMSKEGGSASSASSWPDYLKAQLGGKDADASARKKLQKAGCSEETTAKVMHALKWLGVFDSSEKIAEHPNALTAFCALLEKKLQYKDSERDMVLMNHEVEWETASGERKTEMSTLVAFGDDKYTAMARTVGFPTAAAADLVLRGKCIPKGVRSGANTKELIPVLEEVKRYGIGFTHGTQS